jgi:hypothetical protein
MKNEQEFLAAMWSDISIKEWEAEQKQKAHELNSRLFIKEIFAYGIIVALLTAGSLIALLIKDNSDIVYAVAIFLLSVAFFTEKIFYSKSGNAKPQEDIH